MSEENKVVLRRFFQEIWSQGNVGLIDELFARDWVGHAPPREFSGPAELKGFIVARRRACPDLQVTIEDQIAEGDKVATRWIARGLHRGATPAGESATRTGTTVARLANGKIIEGWALL